MGMEYSVAGLGQGMGRSYGYGLVWVQILLRVHISSLHHVVQVLCQWAEAIDLFLTHNVLTTIFISTCLVRVPGS